MYMLSMEISFILVRLINVQSLPQVQGPDLSHKVTGSALAQRLQTRTSDFYGFFIAAEIFFYVSGMKELEKQGGRKPLPLSAWI